MNREIKFRAWLPSIKAMTNIHTIFEWSKVLNGGDLQYKDIQPEVVFMQYTDLKDKNGVEIYEGDLIKYAKKESFCKNDKCEENHRIYMSKFCPKCGTPITEVDFERIAEIRFMNGGFCFYEEQHHDDGNTYTAWQTYIAEIYIEWKEIIGNIHQNPELFNKP